MIQFPELAMLAVIAAAWRQVRGLFDRVRGLFVQQTTLQGGVARAVSDYLFAEAYVVRAGDALVESASLWVRPLDRMREVAIEAAPAKPVVAFWRRRPVVFRRSTNSNGPGTDMTPSHDHILFVLHVRGTMDISEMIRAALDWSSDRETKGQRYRVRHIGGKSRSEKSGRTEMDSAPSHVGIDVRPGMRFLHWKEEEIGSPQSAEPFTAYALGSCAAAARDDFRRWCGLKSWYLDRGIPWRRGHLLYGPPGTGKTALVRALAQEADMPVFSYDLSSLANDEFRYEWRQMQESAPCIALIEDIDGVFNGRTNVLSHSNTTKESITFDCLLNALGGIETADGVFVVVTTNRPETLDDALGRPTDDGSTTRPGRLDRAFCLPLPDQEQCRSILLRITGEASPDDLAATKDMTAAQVTEWAVSKALAAQWK
jgi:hypothetical protein